MINVKYINNDNEIIKEGNYNNLVEALEDLIKVIPFLSIQRLRKLSSKQRYDVLEKYIIITRLKYENNK